MTVFRFALFAVLLGLPARAANVVAEPFPPASFDSLYIERDDAGSLTVFRGTGDTINYKVTKGDKVVEELTVRPSGDDWFQFIQKLNAAKVYQWSPKYEYPGQGGSWVIDLVMADRKFGSEGSNDYPMNGNVAQPNADPKAGPTIPFLLFWQAVMALVGKDVSGTPVK
jgi:hypothetical protein